MGKIFKSTGRAIFCLSVVAALIYAVPQAAPAAVAVQIGQNIQGATFNMDSLVVPPDADGAIGLNHYVQLVNGSFKVYAKTNGALVQSISDSNFWAAAGVNLNGLSVSDPRVFYDPATRRWFASQIDYDPNTFAGNDFLIAISSNSNPSGPWQAVAFPADTNGNFADFPTLGLDANGVYISGNMFQAGAAGGQIGVEIVSLPKSDLLQATPTATNRTASGILPIDTWGFSLQPVVNFDATNGAESVVAVTSDGADFRPHNTLAAFVISNASSPPAQFTNLQSLAVPDYNVPINPPQPDGMATLDDGDSRISASIYKTGNFLYAAHGTQIGPRAALRWYKLDAGSHALLESGTLSDTNLDLFYPSIAANTNGLVVIGFNGCSTNTFVSSYAVIAETINGSTVFGDKILLKAGAGNYEVSAGGDVRWGDYSAMSVDPVNPNQFWTIQEIPSARNVWSVQITELTLTVEPTLVVAVTNGEVVVSWPTNSPGFALQSNPNLATTNWTAVLPAPTVVSNNFVVTNLASGDQFYRLVK